MTSPVLAPDVPAPAAAAAAVAPAAAGRWTFAVPTPLGITHSTYEIADDGLRYACDDPMGGGDAVLPWPTIRQGGTAAMAGMGGPGAPELPNWIPAQLEWLMLSRAPGTGPAFMRVLPQGGDRNAIVAAIQARLGAAWIGERLSVQDAQKTLGITEGTWGTLKVVGLVVAVLATLALLLILFALLFHPVVTIPAGALLGSWVCRKGMRGLSAALAVENTPTARAGSAAIGFVELEGRAFAPVPTAAPISGRACAWWDVRVFIWSEGSQGDGEWREVASRHDGRCDLVELEDDTGRLPIWLQGATLLLENSQWESGKDALPESGIALLDAIGFRWNSGRSIRVVEECVEVGQPLYVLGTLDERRRLPELSEANVVQRALQQIVDGQWRRTLVAAVPAPLRIVVSVTIGYLGLLTRVGSAGERGWRDVVSAPPPLDPNALVVWKGRSGQPFLVSNRAEAPALAALKTRSRWVFGIGVAALCFTVYQIVDLLVRR